MIIAAFCVSDRQKWHLHLNTAQNSYKFKVFGSKKFIRGFSYKGWNVKSLNNLLKKLRDSGSMTRRTGSGRRRCVRSDASLVFTRYSAST